MKAFLAWGIALMINLSALHAQQSALTTSNNTFAFDMYRQLSDTSSSNLVFSPYSISLALAMTYAGAEGQTASQIANTLHWPDDQSRVHNAFSALQKDLQTSSNPQLDLANAIWIQQNTHILASYLTTLSQHYQGYLGSADFYTQGEAATRDINRWVADRTAGKIDTLFAPGSLDPLTRAVLVNAVHFKGSWATQFPTKTTRPMAFHLLDNSTPLVPTMQLKTRLAYGALHDTQVLALPFAGGDLSMLVIVPKSGLGDLESKLTPATLHDLTSSLREQQVLVCLPRFTIQADLDLRTTLSKLGMPDAFNAKANFAGINGKLADLYIAKAVHQATLEVTEEGAEATAASGIDIATRGLPDHPVFRADRPFVFLIRHNSTGAILFLGRVTDPR